MVFSRIWPALLLLAIPMIIILYILKPKGKEKVIPSSLLWKRTLRNVVSRSRLEKFRSDILFFLEIVAAVLFALALMEPLIERIGTREKQSVLVIDTSAGMEFSDGGKTRFEEAIDEAIRIVRSSPGEFSILAVGDDAELIQNYTSDDAALVEGLKKLSVSDLKGNLAKALPLLSSLNAENVLVFTDGQGAGGVNSYEEAGYQPSVYVFGKEAQNTGISSFVVKGNEAVVMCQNFGDAVNFDLSIRDEAGNLISLRSVSMEQGETRSFVFRDLAIPEGIEYLSCEMSGLTREDGLERDNVAYAVLGRKVLPEVSLVGRGNIYLERALYAVTGELPIKGETEIAAENLVFYDAGTVKKEELSAASQNSDYVAFIKDDGENVLEHAIVTFPETVLSAGLSEFRIGVVKTAYFDVPEWAEGFAYSDGQCVAYYGNDKGKKRVVFGFDLRDTDFALTPEFPIMISGILQYIEEDGILTKSAYSAKASLLYSGAVDTESIEVREAEKKAGIYPVKAKTYLGEEKKAHYIVDFPAQESDGRLTEETMVYSGAAAEHTFRFSLKTPILVLLLIILILHAVFYIRSMGFRRSVALLLMLLTILTAALSMFPIRVRTIRAKPVTIFVADVSDSNKASIDRINDYLAKTLRDKPDKNEYGIVVFGQNAAIEQFVTEENHFTGIMSKVDSGGSNFTDAILLAESLIPDKGSGRIVLLSDNIETTKDISKVALSSNIELCNIRYESLARQDVNISSVKLPENVYPGDIYKMRVTVYSSVETDAELVIRGSNSGETKTSVHLNRGDNTFSFEQTAGEDGLDSYVVEIFADGDEVSENNRYHAETNVVTAPRTLIVSGMKQDSKGLQSMLESGNIAATTVSAINAPKTLEEMLHFRSIVLDNVSVWDLPEGFLENIESYVKDFGGGLIAAGGEDAFMLGGYRDTALEKVLPIDMKLQGLNYLPPTAMVMIIDRSGSMEGTGSGEKLGIAIDSCVLALDVMEPDDYCGVITFDDKSEWVFEPTEVTDRKALAEKVRSISIGGGTTIAPSLELAVGGLSKIKEGTKHIVLLTDGEGETTDFSAVEKKINDAGITLSTIAVGIDSDRALLQSLADHCGGRYYYASKPEEITQLFAREVMISGDSYIQSGSFSLMVDTSNELTEELFMNGWPGISGYIAATPKPASSVLIASDRQDPILTVIRYGLGKTIAWNTSASAEWNEAYVGSPDYLTLWKRMVDTVTNDSSTSQDKLEIKETGNGAVVRYIAKDYGEETEIKGKCTSDKKEMSEIHFHMTEPGVYEADLEDLRSGSYIISAERTDSGSILVAGHSVQYSNEYRLGLKSDAVDRFVESFGRVITEQEDIWKNVKQSSSRKKDISLWILGICFLFFVAEIILRRLGIDPVISFKKKDRNRNASIDSSSTGLAEDLVAGEEGTSKKKENGQEKKQGSKTEKKDGKKKKEPEKPDNSLDVGELLKKKQDRNL